MYVTIAITLRGLGHLPNMSIDDIVWSVILACTMLVFMRIVCIILAVAKELTEYLEKYILYANSKAEYIPPIC